MTRKSKCGSHPLCSCLVCVKERIGIEMPLECIYKESLNYPPSPPEQQHKLEEVYRLDEVCHSQLEIISGEYILRPPSVWITVKAIHSCDSRDISVNIRQDEEGVKVTLFPLNYEEGNPLATCKAAFPPHLESKILVTDYGYRLGWSQDSQLDVLSDFINNKNLEGDLKVYLDNLADEEIECEETVAADYDARGDGLPASKPSTLLTREELLRLQESYLAQANSAANMKEKDHK